MTSCLHVRCASWRSAPTSNVQVQLCSLLCSISAKDVAHALIVCEIANHTNFVAQRRAPYACRVTDDADRYRQHRDDDERKEAKGDRPLTVVRKRLNIEWASARHAHEHTVCHVDGPHVGIDARWATNVGELGGVLRHATVAKPGAEGEGINGPAQRTRNVRLRKRGCARYRRLNEFLCIHQVHHTLAVSNA